MGIIKHVPPIIEKFPGGGVAVTTLDWVMSESRANSMWYLLFGTACCAIELMATGASRYDFDRLGMIFRASPRQADLIIAAGTITKKFAPRLRLLYDQMAEPRYVIAMGGCTCGGGRFIMIVMLSKKGSTILSRSMSIFPAVRRAPNHSLKDVSSCRIRFGKKKSETGVNREICS